MGDGDERLSARPRLLLGEPDGADLRAGEHRMGCRPFVVGVQVVGVQQVVLHHLGLTVGHVLQLMAAVDVAQGPHAGSAGTAVLVDHDVAELVDRDPRLLDLQLVAVGNAARCHEQHVAFDGARPGITRHLHPHAIGGHVDGAPWCRARGRIDLPQPP